MNKRKQKDVGLRSIRRLASIGSVGKRLMQGDHVYSYAFDRMTNEIVIHLDSSPQSGYELIELAKEAGVGINEQTPVSTVGLPDEAGIFRVFGPTDCPAITRFKVFAVLNSPTFHEQAEAAGVQINVT